MTWVSTRALVEGKEPGYGAGCGGVAISPCAAGLCSSCWRCLYVLLFAMLHCSQPWGCSKAAYAAGGAATAIASSSMSLLRCPWTCESSDTSPVSASRFRYLCNRQKNIENLNDFKFIKVAISNRGRVSEVRLQEDEAERGQGFERTRQREDKASRGRGRERMSRLSMA